MFFIFPYILTGIYKDSRFESRLSSVIYLAIAVSFYSIFIWHILIVLTTRIQISGNGQVVIKNFISKRSFYKSDIEKVRLGSFNSEYIIHLKNARKVRLSECIVGVKSIIKTISDCENE